MAERENHDASSALGAAGAGALFLAFMGWNDPASLVPSWASPGVVLTIRLATTGARNDARVRRAVAAAVEPSEDASWRPVYAYGHFRHSEVHVTAPTFEVALDVAFREVEFITDEFEDEGPGQLYADVPLHIDLAPSARGGALLTILTYGSPLLGLLGVGLLGSAFRGGATGLPVAGGLTAFAFIFLPAWIFMALLGAALFAAISTAIVYNTRQGEHAARWLATPGRIVHSQTKTIRRTGSDFPSVGNPPTSGMSIR
jgi:hypothetical protein